MKAWQHFISFPRQKSLLSHPQVRGHDADPGEGNLQWNPEVCLGKENKIAPSAYVRLSANSALCFCNVAFSKASFRLLTSPRRVSEPHLTAGRKLLCWDWGQGDKSDSWTRLLCCSSSSEVKVNLVTLLLLPMEHREKIKKSWFETQNPPLAECLSHVQTQPQGWARISIKYFCPN